MTNSYISTFMDIVRKKCEQEELLKEIKDRILDITQKNTSHVSELRKKKDFQDIGILENGVQVAKIDRASFYFIGEISKDGLEVDKDTALLARTWNDREEKLNFLESILSEMGKEYSISAFPYLKDVFDETDRIQKENRLNYEENLKRLVEIVRPYAV